MIAPDRLLDRLHAAARFGATAKDGVNRQALSAEDRAVRAWLVGLARQRGFAVRTDAMANLFIRRAGRLADAAPVLIGSHLDSQPTGGRYDGALGVIAAFECLEALEDQGIFTDFPVEAVAWTNEEGSRFAPGTMGSQFFAGGAPLETWRALTDRAGVVLGAALDETLAALPDVPQQGNTAPAAYVELHIEQGPVLEAEGLPIGIVTGIQGVRWFEVTLDGVAAHAGTTPAAYRRDPLVAATAVLQALAPLMAEDEAARVTCGRFELSPGSINVIPGRVRFTLDFRHPEPARLDAMETLLRAALAAQPQVTATVTQLVDLPSCAFPAEMVELIESGAGELGLAHRRLLSGAFHDALYMARLCPTGMIFIPCRDGLSHNEAEYADPADIVAGTRLLLAATLRLANRGL